MSITTLTVNGVTVETTDSSLVLSVLGITQSVLPTPTAQEPKAAQESEPKQSKRTTAKSKSAKPKTTKSAAPKVAQPKADLLAEIRTLTRQGSFAEAKSIIPKGWVQVFAEVDRAEQRAASAQEPKAAGKQRAARKPKSAKPKTVPTGTEGAVVSKRITPKETASFTDWKNGFSSKTSDLLSMGDPDEIASAWAELGELIDAIDQQTDLYEVGSKEAGLLIAKACFLADQRQRLCPEALV